MADLTLAYGHFVQHHEEEQSLVVSFADPYWIVGYIFFSLHLFTALRFVRRDQIHAFSVIMVVIASGSIIAYNLILPSGSFAKGEGRIIGEIRTGFIDLVLSILYPILDLVLIIPSVIILTVHRKDYLNFMPWILSSLSLLINAIADDGFVHHFLQGSTKEMWIWDLFSWQIISFWLELFIGTTDFTIPWKWKDNLLNMLLAQVPYFTISLRSLEIISSLITDHNNTFYIWSGIPGRHKLKSKNLPRFARESKGYWCKNQKPSSFTPGVQNWLEKMMSLIWAV